MLKSKNTMLSCILDTAEKRISIMKDGSEEITHTVAEKTKKTNNGIQNN